MALVLPPPTSLPLPPHLMSSRVTTDTPSPPSPPLGTFIDNGSLVLVELLGQGGYGIVYRALNTRGPVPISYAVKCLPRARTSRLTRLRQLCLPRTRTAQSSGQRQLHLQEIHLHKLASAHPNVVSLHRVVEGKDFTYIVMDYCEGGNLLNQILHQHRYLGQDEPIKQVFLQLLDAVEHSHSLGIYHRDLKPENILCFDGGMRLAVTDFGFATTDEFSKEFGRGSANYMSPECHGGQFVHNGSYSPMFHDIWSLGIILLSILTGRHPWKSASPSDPAFCAYLRDPTCFLPTILPISDEVNALLVRVLDVDWRRRPNVTEVKEHVKRIDDFYSSDVVFQGNVAYYNRELGMYWPRVSNAGEASIYSSSFPASLVSLPRTRYQISRSSQSTWSIPSPPASPSLDSLPVTSDDPAFVTKRLTINTDNRTTTYYRHSVAIRSDAPLPVDPAREHARHDVEASDAEMRDELVDSPFIRVDSAPPSSLSGRDSPILRGRLELSRVRDSKEIDGRESPRPASIPNANDADFPSNLNTGALTFDPALDSFRDSKAMDNNLWRTSFDQPSRPMPITNGAATDSNTGAVPVGLLSFSHRHDGKSQRVVVGGSQDNVDDALISKSPTTASLGALACKRLIDRRFLPHEVLSLIGALLTSKGEVEVVDSLHGQDAQTFVDVIHGALDLPNFPPSLRGKCLKTLCRICGRQDLLPKSLQIPICHKQSQMPDYSGGCADVWMVDYQGLRVAFKALRVYSTNDFAKIRMRFCKEVITWGTLRHPNVLPLLGAMMGDNRFIMVSEWMTNGNINEFIKMHPNVNLFELLQDVAKGLVYMHDQDMIHGDLKGANILIDQTGHARLADFGFLTIVSDPMNPTVSSSLTTIGGTVRWMSPELLDPERFYPKHGRPTKESDCYAFGMVIYEVLSRQAPFAPFNVLVVMRKVIDGERPERPEGRVGLWFTDDLWETLNLCWGTQPKSRPGIDTVLECLEQASGTAFFIGHL